MMQKMRCHCTYCKERQVSKEASTPSNPILRRTPSHLEGALAGAVTDGLDGCEVICQPGAPDVKVVVILYVFKGSRQLRVAVVPGEYGAVMVMGGPPSVGDAVTVTVWGVLPSAGGVIVTLTCVPEGEDCRLGAVGAGWVDTAIVSEGRLVPLPFWKAIRE